MKQTILNDLFRKIEKLENEVWELHKDNVTKNVHLEQILKNQQEKISKAHPLVIIYNGVSDIRVYENGKDITKGITNIFLDVDRPPVIEYKKVVAGIEED